MTIGSLQHSIYKQLKVEAAEEARVNSKSAALQKRLVNAEMKWIQADKARIEAEKKAAAGAAGVPVQAAPAVPAPQAGFVSDNEPSDDSLKGISLQQKALIDESGKMLEYLRNEVFKLRGKNYLLRTDVTQLKEANATLTEHNSSVSASFEALKQHATQLSKTNMKLIVDTSQYKQEVTKLRTEVKSTSYSAKKEVAKLREELKKKEQAHQDEIVRLKRELGKKSRSDNSGSSSNNKNNKRDDASSVRKNSKNKRSPAMLDDDEVADGDEYRPKITSEKQHRKAGRGSRNNNNNKSSNSSSGKSKGSKNSNNKKNSNINNNSDNNSQKSGNTGGAKKSSTASGNPFRKKGNKNKGGDSKGKGGGDKAKESSTPAAKSSLASALSSKPQSSSGTTTKLSSGKPLLKALQQTPKKTTTVSSLSKALKK